MDGKQLKNSILQWAIQGKLVPQDPNDEPASVLLDKIRKEKEHLVKEKKIKRDKNASVIFRGDDNSYYEKCIATGEVKCIDEEIPFEIPKGWEWERLGNITTIKGGKRIPAGMKLTIENTGHKYIRVADMKNHSVKSDDIHYITDDIYEIIKAYYISKDDLYITVAGTIGKVGVVPKEFDNANLTENADKIEIYFLCKLYLLYALLSEVVQEQVRKCTTKVGQPKLAILRIQKFLIPIAPLAEQRRISDRIDVLLPIVDRYDILFSKLRKLNNSINEVLKKSILQEAIQGRLVPQKAEEGTANELLEQIRLEKQKLVKEGKLKKSALNDSIIFKGDDNRHYEKIGKTVQCIEDEIPFEIPESWAWVRLSYVAEIARGGSPRPIKEYQTDSVDGINWIKIGDTEKDGKYINSAKEKITKDGVSKSRMVYKGDFLLTNSMSFGRPYITNINGCVHDGWLVISPISNSFDQDFLYHLLSSGYAYKQFAGKASGAVVQNLNRDKVASALFPIPPYTEQQRIVAQIDELFEQLR